MKQSSTFSIKKFTAKFFRTITFSIVFCLLTFFTNQLSAQIVGDTVVCSGDTASYSAPYYSGSVYLWSVSGGTYVANNNSCLVTWANNTPGTINVLISGHGFYTIQVTIHPKPIISISRTQGMSICGGTTGTSPDPDRCDFSACEFGYEIYTANYNALYSYNWQVSGGTILSGQNTNQIAILWGANGNGSIKLFETNAFGCIDSLEKCVKIIQKPTAKFSANGVLNGSSINICKGGNVIFFDSSSNHTFTNWFFGDGGVSSMNNTTHTYYTSGIFTATLVVENACRCKDTARITVIVDTSLAPDLSCISQVCYDNSSTYCTSAPCNNFVWNVTGGTITGGGTSTDSCITILWGPGPYGTITLALPSCPGYCPTSNSFQIPIIGTNGPITGDTSVCSGEQVLYSLPEFCGSIINWNVINPIGVSFTLSPANSIHQQYITWFGNGSADVIVDYYNSLLGCGGKDTLHVLVKSTFGIFGNTSFCQYQVSSLNSNGSAFWIVNGGTITAGQSTSNITINWNSPAGNYQVIAIPLLPNLYCNDTAKKIITIKPTPVQADSISGPDRICPNTAHNYTAHFNPLNGILSWTVQNGVYSITGNNSINVLWGNSGPYSITVSQKSMSNNCSSLPFTKNIYLAGVDSFIGFNTACANTYSSFIVYGSNNVNWNITPSSIGSIVSGQGSNSITVLWNNTQGPAVISYDVCGITYTHNVNVIAKPVFLLTPSGSLCPNTNTTITVSPSFTTYNWNSGASFANSFTISNTANIHVQLTAANGCVIDTTIYIQYLPAPIANITTASQTAYCIPSTPNALLYALVGIGYTYQWQLNAVNIPLATNNNYLALTAGNYRVVVTDTNGCTAFSNIIPITVDSCPSVPRCFPTPPEFVLANQSPLYPHCDSILFNNLSSAGVTNFVWSFGDLSPSVSTVLPINVIHHYTAAGFYLVTLSGQVRCLTDTTIIVNLADTLVVEIPLVADFDTFIACQTVNFTDLSVTTYSNNIVAWQWEFGNGDSSFVMNPTYSYPAAGLYQVTLTVFSSNGCITQKQKTILINPKPIANFTVNPQSCVNTSIAFTNLSTGVGLQYLWDFGDFTSSTVQNTFHTYSIANTYLVNLYVNDQDGCKDTFNLGIIISPNTINAAIFATDTSFCVGDSAIITAFPTGNSYLWNTGSTNQTITALYGGYYQVSITDSLNCKKDTGVFIKVNNFPPSLITVSPSPPYCMGTPVTLNACVGNDYTYLWDDSSTNCMLTIYTDDSATVYITDTIAACSISQSVIVLFNPAPIAPIITASQTSFCDGDSATLTATYAGGTILWSTGSTANSITVTQMGTYTCTITDSIGCSATSSIYITVNPMPDLCSVISGCYEICDGDSICVNALFASYQWIRNDSLLPSDTNQCIVINISGTYKVILTTFFGCTDTSDDIELSVINCADTCYTNAQFTKTTNADTVFLNNLSSGNGSLTYIWDFGDGDSSFLMNPFHVYASDGTYTICLYVTNTTPVPLICKDSICDTVKINTTPVCFEFAGNFPSGIQYDTIYQPIIRFYIPGLLPGDITDWDFTCNTTIDTTTVGYDSVYYNYGINGIFTCCATITRIIGTDTCVAYLTKSVFVSDPNDSCVCDSTFDADVNAGYTFINTGSIVKVVPIQLNDCDTVSWNWGDMSPLDTTIGNDTAMHIYANAGEYLICMKVVRDGDTACTNEYCLFHYVTSIHDLLLVNNIKIFPNPTHDKFQISLNTNSTYNLLDIEITDKIGNILATNSIHYPESNKELDISNLSAGIYYIRVKERNLPNTTIYKIFKY